MVTVLANDTGSDEEALRDLARLAAWKILSKQKEGLPPDPRNPVFASEYIFECDRLLAATPALLQEAIENAGHAAEGANVDPYQGIVEVLQNAEDRRASDVRIRLRESGSIRQMLIVHNGDPVEYEHVLAMLLPFVTTKREDADLWGRFGIGLKTLRRISTDVQVHGSPYHFGSGEAVSIVERDPEPPIAGFYDAEDDTMLVLDLETDFDPDDFVRWFDGWTDDGLIFLDHVRRFTLYVGGSQIVRSTRATSWTGVIGTGGEILRLQRRTVHAGDRNYLVYRAHVQVPPDRQRFHKRTAAMTPVSIATAGSEETAGIFVGLRSRIPTSLPFAIDAQFDPISSREGIQENRWNEWLIGRVGEVLAQAAAAALRAQPRRAWHLVPVPGEGVTSTGWPADPIEQAFGLARRRFAELARFGPERDKDVSSIAYESPVLTDILEPEDLEKLAPNHLPLARALRDRRGRWRHVLNAIGASREVVAQDLIAALPSGAFASKPPSWWVKAAARLTSSCSPAMVFGAPIWLCGNGKPVSSQPIGSTDRKIVFGCEIPALSARHNLFDVLHPEFACDIGRSAIEWLVRHAAFTSRVGARDELLAFAAAYEYEPLRIEDRELREIRDLLDPLTGRLAEEIGGRVGASVLIEAAEAGPKGARSWRRPSELYLPKAIDKEYPNWPQAAAGIGGLHWVAPSYEERLRTGLGKQRKRADGTRSRGARNFLVLLGAETAPRTEVGPERGERSASRRASMLSENATSLRSDIRSPDIERVLRAITDRKRPRKERRDRAIGLLKSLSRSWARRLQDESIVQGQHKARVHTYLRGTHPAHWLDRLRETAWIPVGRDRFKKPTEAAVKTPETQAMYRSEDFIAGVAAEELDEDFAEAIGLTSRVRASDLLSMLEEMRGGAVDFDAARVRLAYQHFSRLVPKTPWPSSIGDVPIAEFRSRFSAGRGLVLVVAADGAADWRRPAQVRRGKQIIPDPERYVIDRDAYRPLWKALQIEETGLADSCEYLKEHAERFGPDEEDGVLIQVYRHMSALLGSAPPSQLIRHMPLACIGGWRARRPILLIEDAELRERLAVARPYLFFWRLPCDTRSLGPLVDALSVTRASPIVLPRSDRRAREEGEDLTGTFRAAVDHLSNTLGKASAAVRLALTVPWEELRAATLFIYEDDVPVEVDHHLLGPVLGTHLRAHLRREPLELHVARDALGNREGAGAAVATLFDPAVAYPFDAEWVLAWQAAEREAASALRFAADDDAHAAKMAAAAAQIAGKAGGTVKLQPRKNGADPTTSPPPPARQLKDFQPGISSVAVVEGKAPEKPKGPARPNLKRRKRPSRTDAEQRLPNTSYTTVQLEDFGWDVLRHVLERADGKELEDFRRRHGVGADGSFDWEEFVELKATGRSMQTSVSLTPSEFARALERGNDYILALVHDCEKGSSTKVKLIFDPARRASLRETEGIRLSGLQDAAGILMELGEDGELTAFGHDPQVGSDK